MWRSLVGLLLLGCATVPVAPGESAFEKAKRGDEAKRLVFLDQLLGKWIYDKVSNPDGYVKAWYYMPSTTHTGAGCHCGGCSREALKEEYQRDVRKWPCMPNVILLEISFEKRFASSLRALESPAGRITPFYRISAPLVTKKYQGILLVGDIFSLTYDEPSSALEDFIITYIKDCEEGMVFKHGNDVYELYDYAYIPDLKEIAIASLIILHARSIQIQQIASGARKVSVEYRQAVVNDYLRAYRLLSKRYAEVKDILENGNLSGSVYGPLKIVVDSIEATRGLIRASLRKVGLEHREVNRDTHEYTLEGF